MVFITAIKMGTAGRGHEHITNVRWLSCTSSKSLTMSVAAAVEHLNKGNRLHVATDGTPVEVKVVNANPPYIRTVANEKWTDNLLALPRF